MTLTKCDRCGTIAEGEQPSAWTKLQPSIRDQRISWTYDLCFDCYMAFGLFLDAAAVEKSEPEQAGK
jgi:hypothetical protein